MSGIRRVRPKREIREKTLEPHRRLSTACRSPEGSSPFDGSLRPDEPPDAGPLDQRRRSVGERSLRQGRQGDTVQAIAPDAATLRSRHVARRMDCGSSWTLLRIVTVAAVDVGRAQVAASRSQLVFPLHLRDASPQLRHEIWSRSARAALPPLLSFAFFYFSELGLFNGLRPKKVEKISASLNSPPGCVRASVKCALLHVPSPRRRRAGLPWSDIL